jgi:hypothetical protein
LSTFSNDYCIKIVDCSTSGGGKAGGLALMWKNCNFQLNIMDYALNYIDCVILSHNTHWRATGIYGYPVNNQKILTCNLISDLATTNSNSNWLVFGDFNIVLSSREKSGGNPIDYHITEAFRDCLGHCNLEDLGYQGQNFTWHNRQQDNQYIQARLVRFCASQEWSQTFPYSQNLHLLRYGSDHCPLLLDFSTYPPNNQIPTYHSSKKFEQIWLDNEEHTQIVKNAWDNLNQDLQHKLDGTLNSLHNWGKKKFGHIPRKITIAQNELKQLNEQNDQNTSGDLIGNIRDKERELDDLLHQEEMWWNQRSRVLWLKHGDKNTRFFHQKASQRRKKNRIEAITNSMGIVQTSHDNIETTLISHFQGLFTSQTTTHIPETVDVVKNCITEHMYNYLQEDFTMDEVTNAIKDMKSLAAPGPDGMPALFYQTYWDIVGKDVTEAALHVLNNKGTARHYNHTNICLIPKHNNPTHPSDFRPIALCNVTLKIITKTIANRLKTILPDVISQNQSAFVPGRLITDNILVAYEIFHHFDHNNSKKGYMGIKTDMAKAYDRVEWQFLKTTLEVMGFPHQLTDTIMDCVSTVTFSILINGKPSDTFTP